jgi:heme-degrading monooxygenase HmoA
MSPEANLVSISIFTPKPEHFDAFVTAQVENLPRLGSLSGSLGARFYAAKDGRHAILVSFFEKEVDQQQFQQTDAFQAHRQRLQPLLESNDSTFYTLVYAHGAPAG